MSDCNSLLSPGKIGTMQLRNRIAVTAMGVNLAEADGTVGERLHAYHTEQARGGAGLIIMGATAVAWPVAAVTPYQTGISEERFVPGLKKLADSVHSHGAKIAVQLQQGGLNSVDDAIAGRPMWTPSKPKGSRSDTGAMLLPEEVGVMVESGMAAAARPEFKVLELEDIKLVVRQFASAAKFAQQAGIDAVEIHGAHGYLLGSFLSPSKNSRTDEYGGSLENRARFLLEVIRAVRETVGADYPIICKLDRQEVGVDGGINLQDALTTARWVEAAGADAITMTAYHDTDRGVLHSGSHTPHEPAQNLPFAADFKKVVGIPIIASGRVEPAVGDQAIAAGKLDFLAMGRKLLADPNLPNKLIAKAPADIRPCIYCYTCISAIYLRDVTRCAVNSQLGLEYAHGTDAQLSTPASRKLKTVVVGGGPGGMEAARRLSLSGHSVTLLEQGETLGGTLQFASLAYEPNGRLLQWLRRQVGAMDIDVRLNSAADAAQIAAMQPDVTIVAAGARRILPELKGADLPHVFSGDDMRKMLLGLDSEAAKRLGAIPALLIKLGTTFGLTRHLGLMRWMTRFWMPFGPEVVIVGGALVGLELAEFLLERGLKVTVIDEDPVMGAGLAYVRRMRILTELREHGAQLYTSVSDIAVEVDAVVFCDAQGQSQRVSAKQVVVAKGAEPNNAMESQLRDAGMNVVAIGDCTGVSYIEGAMRGAADAVRNINQNLESVSGS